MPDDRDAPGEPERRRGLRDRPASEGLIIILGCVVAFVLVLEACALVILAFVDPGSVTKVSGIFQTQIQIVIGAVLGYATGRAQRDGSGY